MGLPADELAEARKAFEADATEFLVHPDNWPIVDVFCAMETQWQVAVRPDGILHHQGLNYAVLDAVASRLQPDIDGRALLAGLKTMELAAREARNKA